LLPFRRLWAHILKFAEFKNGQILQAGPYCVTEQEVITYAKQWDPQWFHTDPLAASKGPFEGLIASGWHTCAVAMRLVADAFLADSESYASPGLSYIKWPHPMRPNDELKLSVTVIEKRSSKSNPTLGILRWRWQMHNQVGHEVLDLEVTSLFKL
jgi:acyl dehydratase